MAAPLAIVALRSHRAGENGQIEALAEALSRRLSAPLTVLSPRWRLPEANLLSLTHQVSLRGAARLALPNAKRHLIISAALRNEALARALAQQSPQGMTVFLGRTWAPPDAFSLTVTTPQYRRPAHPRVLENPLTLHGLNEASLNAAREAGDAALLRGEGQALGVLIGGPSGTYTLGPKSARRLLAEAQALAGSRPLWVTTSPRTPSAALARLAAHPWRPQDRFLPWGSGTNPYRAILARAGALLVTGDSIAMLSEALGTGKVVRVFDLGDMAQRGSGRPRDRAVQSLAYSALFYLGPQRLSRDLRCVFEGLRDRPQFAFSPTPIPPEAWGQGDPAAPQLEATLNRIAALLQGWEGA
ncbi:MAG: ELM1/GtrOC1 family putative glycosyltransferase [Pseudomonadales bacterium]